MSPEMEPSVLLSKSSSASLPMVPGPPTWCIEHVPDLVVSAHTITTEGTMMEISEAVVEQVAHGPVSCIDASDNVEMDNIFPVVKPNQFVAY